MRVFICCVELIILLNAVEIISNSTVYLDREAITTLVACSMVIIGFIRCPEISTIATTRRRNTFSIYR